MRRFLFHLQELEPEEMRQQFGYYDAGGYGTQISMGRVTDADVTIQEDQAELVFWYDVSGLTDTDSIDKAFNTLVTEKFTEVKNA